jgi:hypothetical protein
MASSTYLLTVSTASQDRHAMEAQL